MRAELCAEALRLGRLLVELLSDRAGTYAIQAAVAALHAEAPTAVETGLAADREP